MRIYIVQKGDTLFEIAKKNGATLEEVMKLNPQLSSPDLIMPGMKIKIPGEMKQIKGEKEKQVKAQEKFARTNERPMGNAIESEQSLEKKVAVPPIKSTPSVQPIFQAPKIKAPLEKKTTVANQGLPYKKMEPPTKMKEFPQIAQSENVPLEPIGPIAQQWNQQPTCAYMPVSPVMRRPVQEMGYPPMICPCCMRQMMMLPPYPLQMNQGEFSPYRQRRNYCPYI